MTAVTHLTNQSQFVQSNANFAGTNISGTINSSGISLSVAPGGGGADGYNILAAGTQTANTTGTILFSNSNGITFGMSNSSVITASHNGITSQTVQPVAVSGSNGSFSFSTLTFGNSNGLSFYTTNGSMVGSYTVPTVTNSSATVSAGTTSNTLGNLVFSNSNGVSFGLNAGTITATVKTDYLTTARASNDAIGLNTALTAGALSVTANSSGLSINAGGLAGTSSGFAGNSISGSITHNTAGINISLNHPAWLTTAMQSNAVTISNIKVSAGTTSNNLSALTFSNANGITFGLNASTITASHNGLTTAAQSNQVVNSLNGSTGQISLNVGSSLSASTNGSSITFGLASNITTALQSANANYLTSQSNQAVSAANGSFTFQTLTFANSNGVSFSTGTQGLYASHNGLTTARASNDAIGLNTAGTNVTWTVNSNGLSLNASGYVGTATGFSGTNVSATMTHNSAGFSLQLSAAAGGGAESNNFNLLGANTAGNTTASGSTIGLSGVNLTLSGTNNSVINISAPATSSIVGVGAITISTNGSTISISGGTVAGAPVQISAGTTSNNLGTINFANSNGVTFGLNGSTITASAAGGGGATYSGYDPYRNAVMVAGQIGQGSVHFQPVEIPNVTFDRFVMPVIFSGATNSTGSYTATFNVGIYTLNGSTLSQLTSVSANVAWNHSGTQNSVSNAGMRLFTIGTSGSLSEGKYWFAVMSRTSSSSANASFSQFLQSNPNSNFSGLFSGGGSTYGSMQFRVGQGLYSATQTGLPGSAALSHIYGSGSIGLRAPIGYFGWSTF